MQRFPAACRVKNKLLQYNESQFKSTSLPELGLLQCDAVHELSSVWGPVGGPRQVPCQSGRWVDTTTLQKCYQVADAETVETCYSSV